MDPGNRHMLRIVKIYVEQYVVAVRELRHAIMRLDGLGAANDPAAASG